jgi:hypothetical protein
VLEQSALATHFQICIDFNTATSGYGTLVISPAAGFSGGSTTARPTATDEHVALSISQYLPPTVSSTPFQTVLNVSMSSDGQCTRIWTYKDNQITQLAMFEKLQDPVTGFTNPNVWYWAGNNTSCAAYASMYQNTIYFRQGSTNYGGGMTQEWSYQAGGGNYVTSLFASIPNEVSNEWLLSCPGFMCGTTGARGRHGRFFDLWLGSTGQPDGTCYPGDGSRQFIQVGNQLVLPWNGQPPLIS